MTTPPLRDAPRSEYRLWVNEDSTVLVYVWANGEATVAFRENRMDAWGPPRTLIEEEDVL